MLSALFSGLTTKAAIASGLIGALVAATPIAWVAHNAGYGKMAKEAEAERASFIRRENIGVTREIALYTELAGSRSMQVLLISNIELYWDATDEARAEMRKQLSRHKAEAQRAAKAAADAIAELSRINHEWKSVEVPRPVLLPFCVRDGETGCDPHPAAGAPTGDGLAVRQPAAGDGQ